MVVVSGGGGKKVGDVGMRHLGKRAGAEWTKEQKDVDTIAVRCQPELAHHLDERPGTCRRRSVYFTTGVVPGMMRGVGRSVLWQARAPVTTSTSACAVVRMQTYFYIEHHRVLLFGCEAEAVLSSRLSRGSKVRSLV
jgi:hypothetical protein